MIYAMNNIPSGTKAVIVFQDVSWPAFDLHEARELAREVGAFGVWRPKYATRLGAPVYDPREIAA